MGKKNKQKKKDDRGNQNQGKAAVKPPVSEVPVSKTVSETEALEEQLRELERIEAADFRERLAGEMKDIENKIRVSEDAENKMEELRGIERVDFERKIEAEIENITKDISRLENQIKQKESEKNKKPEKHADGSPLDAVLGSVKKDKNAGESNGGLPVPALERLPETGTLYQAGGQRYLAITTWDEYDTGQSEAERLHAKLCAERSG